MYVNEYQSEAVKTAVYPGKGTVQGLIYTTLKLNGEAGEVAEKVGKALRDNEGVIDEQRRQELIAELGDVLWYVAASASELNVDLQHVANTNLRKLAARKERGTLSGSGDNR